MIVSSKLIVTTISNKVHPATREMLLRYPKSELAHYAQSLGVLLVSSVSKSDLVEALLKHHATICGSLGN